jgi:hypothetical protein
MMAALFTFQRLHIPWAFRDVRDKQAPDTDSNDDHPEMRCDIE